MEYDSDQRAVDIKRAIGLYKNLFGIKPDAHSFKGIENWPKEQMDYVIDSLTKKLSEKKLFEKARARIAKINFDWQIQTLMEDYELSKKEALDLEMKAVDAPNLKQLLIMWDVSIDTIDEYRT